VPMCDDSEGGFVFKPEPFARPDYAITLVGIPVDIDVLRNDFNLFGGDYIVSDVNTSETKGTVEQSSESGPLKYIPKKEFIGIDTFTYTLLDKKTGSTDEAKVTIVVNNPEQVKACYTVDILKCWGDDIVFKVLSSRGIELGPNDDIFEVLLNSLRSTHGFTRQEIDSLVSNSIGQIKRLLECLKIDFSNVKDEQLGELILEYQNNNCGGVEPVTECYTVGILQCWGNVSVQRMLKIRGIAATGDIFQLLLDSLRQTHGFTQDELLKLPDPMIQELLKCMQLNVPTDKKPVDVLIEYQLQNCQAGVNNPAVSVEPGLISVSDLVKVLDARGVTISATESRFTIENALAISAKGNALSESELMILTKESISGILDSKKITFATSENKTQLIKKLF